MGPLSLTCCSSVATTGLSRWAISRLMVRSINGRWNLKLVNSNAVKLELTAFYF